MKKVIFVFAIFMAFVATSFAYSGSCTYVLDDVGYRSESIIMDCQSAGGSAGALNPGFVEVYFYASDGAFPYHIRYDYPDYGQFYWIHPIASCEVNIVNYQYLGVGASGVHLQWVD
nr:hypothetical protein [uncultured Draconibacterium sp.]